MKKNHKNNKNFSGRTIDFPSQKQGSKRKAHLKFHTAAVLVCLLCFLCGISKAILTSAQEDMPQNVFKYYKSIRITDGDTLWTIAEKYKTEDYDSVSSYVDALKEINHLEDSRLNSGESLIVAYNSSELLE